MYRKQTIRTTSLKVRDVVQGETIETKIERIVENNEPIKDGAPTIFTERKEGVLPAYDIRTDRWKVALEAMDKISKTNLAKREAKIIKMNEKKDGGTESTEGTSK